MTTVCTRTLAILMIGIAVSLAGSSVPAESITVYHTDFSGDTPGEMPAGWTAVDSFGTWKVDDNAQLVLDPVTDDSVIVCDAAGVLTDYTVSAKFEFNSGRAGLVGRLQDADSYYSLRLRNTNQFQLFWIGPNDTYGQLGGTVTPDPVYAYGDWLTMSMTFEGSNISCEVRNSSDEVMAVLDVVDTTYTSGNAGLRADSLTYACTEFTVTAIPEPGTVALLISALAGLLIVRRKR